MAKSKRESFVDCRGNVCVYRDDGSLDVRVVNNEPSLTIQSEKDSCDINTILARFNKTGVMSNVYQGEMHHGDFSGVTDYHSALNAIQAAEDAFMQLDPKLRARFQNDPGALLAFLEEPSNRDEAISLGLVNPSQATQVPLDVVDPAPKGDG